MESQYKDYIERNIKSDINSWISSKRERASLDNSAIFKAKDIKFLDEVVGHFRNLGLNPELKKGKTPAERFLQEYGFEPKIKGGVAKSAFNGTPRQYSDIDLVIEVPRNLFVQRPDLREEVARLHRYSNGAEQAPNGWEFEDLTEKSFLYVGTVVDSRFRIKSPKTRTTIDLTFGRVYDY